MNLSTSNQYVPAPKSKRSCALKAFGLGSALAVCGFGLYSYMNWKSEATSGTKDVNLENEGFLQSLYEIKAENRGSGYCPPDKKRCNVLVVVDMQNDYCKGCGSKTESPWATKALLDISPSINQVLGLRHKGMLDLPGQPSMWDLILFTKDSLATNQVCVNNKKDSNGRCKDGSSLVSRTYGNQVISALRPPADVARMDFTKSNDDWFNELDEKKSYNGVRQFALEGEKIPGNPHPNLRQQFQYRYFTPEKTNIFVTGVQTNRCVMKGSVHGTLHGYKVAVIKDGVAGASAPDNWKTEGASKNAPPRPCRNCNRAQLNKWKEEIFLGYKGGPTSVDALKYMKDAGVTILQNAREVRSYLRSQGIK